MRHIKYNDKIKFSNSQTDATHKLTHFTIKRQYPRSSSFNIFFCLSNLIFIKLNFSQIEPCKFQLLKMKRF